MHKLEALNDEVAFRVEAKAKLSRRNAETRAAVSNSGGEQTQAVDQLVRKLGVHELGW